MASERRKARIIALQALYEIDATGHEPETVLRNLLDEADLTEENGDFVRQLVQGVMRNQAQIDDNLHKFAPAWPIDQIAAIDRNILRLAILEILFDNSVPVKVSINEAVELAKSFGGDNSAKFVNGVLGSVSALATKQKALERG